ncbi:MAG: AMP-binding protein [Victivallaceae bacterium]|nr:AMP-binding protein [Victivallaceae bacterium]
MKNNLFVNWLFITVFLGGGAVLAGITYSDPKFLIWDTIPIFLILASAGFVAGGFITFYVRREWRSGVVLPLLALGLTMLGLGYEYKDDWWMFWVACPALGAGGAGILAALGGSERIRGRFLGAAIAAFAFALSCGIVSLHVWRMPDQWWWWLYWLYLAGCMAVSCFVPYLWMRLFALILTHTIYRVVLFNTQRIPDNSGALLMANHVSILDALILLCATPRRIQFMIHESFFEPWPLRLIFKIFGVWKVPGRGKAKEMLQLRENLRRALLNGELVTVFPEGKVSPNGIMQTFRGSIDELLGPVDVPVIPIWLGLLHGPLLNIDQGKLRLNKVLYYPMLASISVGNPIDRHLSGFEMRQVLHEMGAEVEMGRQYREMPIHYQLLRNARLFPFERTYCDAKEKGVPDFMMALKALILSRKIRKLAPETEKYVGVMLPNCTTAAAAIFAVLFADRTPALVNYTSGAAIRRKALEKACVKTVLTSRKFLDKLKLEKEPGMVCLEDMASTVTSWDKVGMMLALAMLPRRTLGWLFSRKSYKDVFRTAILLFSSGSSGVPKGVMLSHRNINCDFFSFFRVIGWSRKDRLLGNLPLFHAFGLTVGFWVPTMARSQVVFVPNPLDAAFTGEAIQQHKLTMIMATPTFLQTYMRRCTREQLSTLRLTITGGEKLRRDIAENFRRLTGLAVVEGYGCTELAPIVSINLALNSFELGREAGRPGSIGVPMPGLFVKIVNQETGKMCQPDEEGVLLVKGGVVMQGYLNDPEATSKVIINGFYNTGDIASMDERGYITITGRLSRFSKISGEMVPDELVELHLNELLAAEGRVLAVTSVADEKRGERLVVIHAVPELDAAALTEELRTKGLPNLWIPRKEDFHLVQAIPLLGSGKIDLQALKAVAESLYC